MSLSLIHDQYSTMSDSSDSEGEYIDYTTQGSEETESEADSYIAKNITILDDDQIVKDFPVPCVNYWRSFTCTYNPPHELSALDISQFKLFVSTHCQYAIVSRENGTLNGKVHIHAALFSLKPCQVSTIKRKLMTYYKCLDPKNNASIREKSFVVSKMFNDDWLDYVRKDGDMLLDTSYGMKTENWIFSIPYAERKKGGDHLCAKFSLLFQEYYPLYYMDQPFYKELICLPVVNAFLTRCWFDKKYNHINQKKNLELCIKLTSYFRRESVPLFPLREARKVFSKQIVDWKKMKVVKFLDVCPEYFQEVEQQGMTVLRDVTLSSIL